MCCVCTSPPSLLFFFWMAFGYREATLHINHMNIVVPANNITRVGLLLRCSIINTQQQTKRSTHFLMSIKKQKSDFCLTLATTSIWKAMNDSQHGNKICIKKNKLVLIYSHGYHGRAVHVCVKWRYSIRNKKKTTRDKTFIDITIKHLMSYSLSLK